MKSIEQQLDDAIIERELEFRNLLNRIRYRLWSAFTEGDDAPDLFHVEHRASRSSQ